MHRFKQLFNRRGNAFIENALWIVLFSFVVGVVVYSLGGETSNAFERVIDKITSIGG